ncbi:MAG: hypothetical protein JWQ66_2385 [Mucilaginibacter sp.]|nr:hypothetical protein [Mucilaginibacter sp.]
MELLPGEKIQNDKTDAIAAKKISDDAINQKYIKGEVRIVTEQARYPLPSIITMLESGNYMLNPEFQRRHRWSILQKSRLIESFIMNVPIPPIFLYEDRYSHYEVMDGLQRLTAIFEFYSNKFSLDGLEQWPELNGKKYQELPSQIAKGVDRRYLSSIILLQETARDEDEANKLKQLVFERINSGGVQLKPQESRNAIYAGPMNDLCIKLARNKDLCKMWGIPEPTEQEILTKIPSDELLEVDLYREMGDVELVLRFFAARQRESLFKNSTNFRYFLDLYLKKSNSFPINTLNNLANLYEDTLSFIHELLGDHAFWLFRNRGGSWNWFKRPTVIIYDALMITASKFLSHRKQILLKKPQIEALLIDFYKINYETFEGRNVNPSIVRLREQRFESFFESLL